MENEIFNIVSETLKYSDIVIVISDGSNDRTAQMARKAGAYSPEEKNIRGKGNAVRRGIEISKEFDSDIIVLMDSDGQHLPHEIAIVVEPILKENYDMVIGSRMKGELKTSFINKIGNVILKIISFFVTFRWVTDTESGFRAYKSEKLYSLILKSERYEIESELLIKSLHKKFTYKEVPITVPKAVPGATVADGIKNGFHKIKFAFKKN